MNKPQQAVYHSIFAGVKNLLDEIQVPALSGEAFYDIFFQMRLDHPEIFWVTVDYQNKCQKYELNEECV